MFLRRTSSLDSNSGYTLVELLVVMGISGMLVVLGTSDFSVQTSRQRLRRTSHQIVSDLRLIRQKAITEGETLSIQFSPKAKKYDLPGHGPKILPHKILFGTPDNIGKIPSGKKKKLPKDGVSFDQNKVTFQPNGTYAGVGGSIYLTNDSPQGETMAITVNMTGRVKLYKWGGNAWQ